ncbi:MAG: hypothetical protein AAF721_06915 [Myxococcota bacterium]
MNRLAPGLVAAWLSTACAADPAPTGSEPGTGEGTTAGPADHGDTQGQGSAADTTTSSGPAPTDGTQTGDASTGNTSAAVDTSTDTGTDDGTSSTGGPLPGLGALSGMCGAIVADDLSAPDPSLFINTIDFGDVGFDYDLLTPGGQEVHDEGNLGGNSLLSEVIAFDVLARCEGAALLKTETEIVYEDPTGTKTDLLVELARLRIGVSVTRAVAFPFEDPYEVATAAVLLEDKLLDVAASTANVAAEDAWSKQILHIIAYTPMHAESMQTAYEALSPAVQGDTIVVVTVTEGDDAFIYD